jgi:hypothetical protein
LSPLLVVVAHLNPDGESVLACTLGLVRPLRPIDSEGILLY